MPSNSPHIIEAKTADDFMVDRDEWVDTLNKRQKFVLHFIKINRAMISQIELLLAQDDSPSYALAATFLA